MRLYSYGARRTVKRSHLASDVDRAAGVHSVMFKGGCKQRKSMVTTLAAFLTDLSETQKSITALLGSFAVGASCMAVLYGFTSLPDRVMAVELQVDSTHIRVDNLEVKLDQAICLLTLPDAVGHAESLRECGL